MKKNYLYSALAAVCSVLLPLLMAGCDKEELASPRLFKPKSLTVEAHYDGLIATWTGTEGAQGYKLEIASDEEFATIDETVDTDGKTRTATLTGLEENHRYYLRLCGTMADAALNSKYIYAEATTGIAYSIFLPVEEDNMTFRTAKLEWQEFVEADKITIEHTSGTSEERELALTEEDLASQSVLIRGLKAGESYKATMYAGEESLGIMRFTMPVKPEGYTVFLPVNEENMTFRTAKLEWRNDEEVDEADKITVEHTSGTSAEQQLALTEADLASRSILISGLSAGESYKATMYAGEESLGVISFTMPAKPELMIDDANAASLQALIDAAPAGATIMFTGETTYDYSGEYIYLRKSITLVGEPGVARPVLYTKGILLSGDAASTSIDAITLQRIEFSGMAWDGQTENIAAEPAAQLLSVDLKNTPELHVTDLKVRDCVVRNFANSFIELISGATTSPTVRIGTIEVDNVLAYDLGRNKTDYASFISITSDKRDAFCQKFIIRNSTFHHLMRGLIEMRGITGCSNPTITIENCTFDEIGNDRPMTAGSWAGTNNGMLKPFLDFKSASAKLEIVGCLFGKMYATKISNTFSQGATITANNSYMLTSSKSEISKGVETLSDLGGTADSLFPDRAQYDYRISPDAGVGNIGDPRWR